MNYTKAEKRLLKAAASKDLDAWRRWEWLMWLNAVLLTIAVGAKIAGDATSTNVAFGMMVISSFVLVISLVRMKYQALQLIHKLIEQSGGGLESSAFAMKSSGV